MYVSNIIGIINTNNEIYPTQPFMPYHCTASLPIGAKYRIIDLILSNMVHSDIHNIGLSTNFYHQDLIRYVGSGKEWDLDRRIGGITVLASSTYENTSPYTTKTRELYPILCFLKNHNEPYVLICNSNAIYKCIYSELLDFHVYKHADLTVVYKQINQTKEDVSLPLDTIEIDAHDKVVAFYQNNLRTNILNVCTGIYLLKRDLFIELIEKYIKNENIGSVNEMFTTSIHHLKVYGYKFEGYWKCLNSLQSYYQCNMDLLHPKILYQLFMQNGDVYTKTVDDMPTKYYENSDVRNSLIADGCRIEGTVHNSVLFPGVYIGKNAIVKNSIILHDSTVGDKVCINHGIINANSMLQENNNINGQMNSPMVYSKI